jgi:hypothetical protein
MSDVRSSELGTEVGKHFQSGKKFVLNFPGKFFKLELVMEMNRPGHGRIMACDTYGFKTIFSCDHASRRAPGLQQVWARNLVRIPRVNHPTKSKKQGAAGITTAAPYVTG